jgi:hypothetical protein
MYGILFIQLTENCLVNLRFLCDVHEGQSVVVFLLVFCRSLFVFLSFYFLAIVSPTMYPHIFTLISDLALNVFL